MENRDEKFTNYPAAWDLTSFRILVRRHYFIYRIDHAPMHTMCTLGVFLSEKPIEELYICPLWKSIYRFGNKMWCDKDLFVPLLTPILNSRTMIDKIGGRWKLQTQQNRKITSYYWTRCEKTIKINSLISPTEFVVSTKSRNYKVSFMKWFRSIVETASSDAPRCEKIIKITPRTSTKAYHDMPLLLSRKF